MAAHILREIPVGAKEMRNPMHYFAGKPSWGKGNAEPHALLCWETRWELQPTVGTSVMDAKVEDHVGSPSQEAPQDTKGN